MGKHLSRKRMAGSSAAPRACPLRDFLSNKPVGEEPNCQRRGATRPSFTGTEYRPRYQVLSWQPWEALCVTRSLVARTEPVGAIITAFSGADCANMEQRPVCFCFVGKNASK